LSRKILAVLAAAGVLPAAGVLLGGTACSQGGFRDLNNVSAQDPDRAILINNVDGFPNVVILCVSGVALTTTTRGNSQAALQHIVELDHICPGYVKPTAG
jgi:hypothetical protein